MWYKKVSSLTCTTVFQLCLASAKDRVPMIETKTRSKNFGCRLHSKSYLCVISTTGMGFFPLTTTTKTPREPIFSTNPEQVSEWDGLYR